MENEKPLFIPLNTEFYEQFESGEKTEELRLYGKRCGHKWTPRKKVVTVCPKCKSPYWDKEKVVKK